MGMRMGLDGERLESGGIMELFIVETFGNVHHGRQIGTEVGVSGKMFAKLGLESHEVAVHGLSFTEVVEDGANSLELEVVLGDRTVLLEAVQLLTGKELGVTALETLAQEGSEVLPWILAFGRGRNMDGPFSRKAIKQHGCCKNAIGGGEL